jgi:hypothetical protein
MSYTIKSISLVFLVIVSFFLKAQQSVPPTAPVLLTVQGKIYEEDDALNGAVITVNQGARVVSTITTGSDGKYNFQLPLGGDYLVSVTKPGLINKKFSITTRGIPPDRAQEAFGAIDAQVTLWKKVDGVDYTALNQPANKYAYSPDRQNFDYDKAYLEQMLALIDNIREQEKALEKKNKDAEKNYQAAIKDGDKGFGKKDYQVALSKYNEALSYKKDDVTAKQKIEQTNEALKADAAAAKAKADADAAVKAKADADAKAKLAADAAAKAKSDADAKAKADADAAAKTKAEADAKAKLAADAAAKAKSDADAKAKADADAAAKTKAEADAKAKLAADAAAKAKSDADAKAKADADAAAKAKADADTKAKLAADAAAKAKSDADAKSKADSDAAAKTKADADAKAKLAEDAAVKAKADDAIAKKKAEEDNKNKSVTELETKYKAAISRGDAGFKKKDWDNARAAYVEALGYKSKEEYPQSQIMLIDDAKQDEIDARKKATDVAVKAKADADAAAKRKAEEDNKNKSTAELESKYKDAVSRGDAGFKKKDWDNARAAYVEALSYKAKEQYPKDQIMLIDDTKQDEIDARKKAETDAAAKAKADADAIAAKAKVDAEAKRKADEEKGKTTKNTVRPTLGGGNDVQYRAAIVRGDNNMKFKQYKEAVAAYSEALTYKTYDAIATSKLTEAQKNLTTVDTSTLTAKKEVNPLALKYPQGVTEETSSDKGVVVIRRIMVKGDEAWVYTKKIFNWGGVQWYKDDVAISQSAWENDTK